MEKKSFSDYLPKDRKVEVKGPPMRSVMDMIGNRTASESGGPVVGMDNSAFKDEILRAMGKKPVAAVTSTGTVVEETEYSSPQEVYDAFNANKISKANLINVMSKIGLIADKDLDEMTPSRAFAVLKEEVDADDVPKEHVAIAAEPFKKGEDYPKKENEEEKKIEKMDDLKLKRKRRKKSQTNPFMQPQTGAGAPTQAGPTQPVTVQKTVEEVNIPTANDIVVMIDPATGQKKQFKVMPDGSYQPVQQVTASITEVKNTVYKAIGDMGRAMWDMLPETERDRLAKSVMENKSTVEKIAHNLKTAMVAIHDEKETAVSTNPTVEPVAKQEKVVAAQAQQELPSNSKSEEKKMRYTAKLKNDRWVVADDQSNIFSVGISDAFEGNEADYTDMWRSSAYGEELESACNTLGLESVVMDTFEGNVTLEDSIVTKIEKTAQYTDGKVMNVEEPMQQEPPAIMNPDIGDKMAEQEQPSQDVIELITQVLAPIISTTDVWDTDKIIEQLKATFTDDEEIAGFKATLDEKVKQQKVNSQVVVEKAKPVAEEKEETDKEDAQNARNTKNEEFKQNMQNKMQQTKAAALKIKEYVADLERKTYEMNKKVASLTEEVDNVNVVNEKLVKERVARLKLPKAKILAEKMTEIGIKTAVKDIMLLSDKEFDTKEQEVCAIYNKVAHRIANVPEYPESLIGGALPVVTDTKIEQNGNPFSSRAPNS